MRICDFLRCLRSGRSWVTTKGARALFKSYLGLGSRVNLPKVITKNFQALPELQEARSRKNGLANSPQDKPQDKGEELSSDTYPDRKPSELSQDRSLPFPFRERNNGKKDRKATSKRNNGKKDRKASKRNRGKKDRNRWDRHRPSRRYPP